MKKSYQLISKTTQNLSVVFNTVLGWVYEELEPLISLPRRELLHQFFDVNSTVVLTAVISQEYYLSFVKLEL